jgi:hypothetical protein
MKEKILKDSVVILTLLAGFFAWFSLSRALGFDGMSAWMIPAALFSVYAIFLCLMAILVKQEMTVEFATVASFLFGFIFIHQKWHILIATAGIFLVLSALRDIRKDLDLNIKVDLWKSLYIGKMKLVLALAIIISSQYFFMISMANGQKSIPKFDLSGITSKLVEPILGLISPNFKAVQQDGLTVDQFIIKAQQENNNEGTVSEKNLSLANAIIDDQLPKNLPTDQREALRQEALKQIIDSQSRLSNSNEDLILQEGRRQFSQLVGHDITGNEKVSDVFAGLIDKKINDYFQPSIKADDKSTLFLYILTAILFLTIWPIGTILSLLWFALVIIIFKLFVYFGWVEIKLVTVQREMIV